MKKKIKSISIDEKIYSEFMLNAIQEKLEKEK